ncbi:DPBB and LysM peptidoglycan-binding domain-containing protein [Parapedobacter sp. DT-150]|uniref:DPBB and LysM peptidoglycan-binding domain-containing protein n=1 Tax=Parapedobacter sp. DT-150 TaxID=3396162 RepID=UPI003F193208
MDITYPYLYRASFLLAMLIGCCSLSSKAGTLPLDSIRVEYENGKKIIIHQLEPKETYYGLSRRYRVPVKQIITANSNKSLKVGDIVRVPAEAATGNAVATNGAAGGTSPGPAPALSQDEFTSYKVGKGETLFTISKRFIISVESIKRANALTDDGLQVGMVLKIPHKELPPPVPKANQLIVADTTADNVPSIPENRYGIREMTEKGVGVWIDDLNQGAGSMLALHKTAPIGTVVKITNPMTNRTALIKVVGKFADTAETRDAIIVISKSAASLIGVLDRRFQIEISYGTPNDTP